MDFLTPKTSLQIPKIVGANGSFSVGVYGDFLWSFLYSRCFFLRLVFFMAGVFYSRCFFTVGVFFYGGWDFSSVSTLGALKKGWKTP